MALNLNIVSKFNEKGVKEAQASFSGIGKKLAGLAGLVAAAFSVTAIKNFAKESIAAAEDVAVANNRLAAIAETVGLFGQETEAVTARLREFAEANEFALATDAEVIKATQAKLLAFKGLAASADEAGGAFDRTTKAAIDMAAAGFGSAESNAAKLGRALEDPVRGMTALARSGVVFNEQEKKNIKTLVESGKTLEAQNVLLQALEGRFGGTALATATASEKMKLAFDNIRETVGAALLPAFNSVADAVLPLVEYLLPKISAFFEEKITPFLTRASDAFKNFTANIRENGFSLGEIFSQLAEGVSRFLEGGGLERAFETIAEMRMNFLNSVMKALPGIIDAFIKFVPQLIDFLLNDLLPMLLREFVFIIGQIAEILIKSLPKLVEALVSMVPGLLRAAITLFNTLIDAVIKILPPLLRTIVETIPEIVKTLLRMLPDILDAGIKLFMALVDAIPEIIPPLLKALVDLIPVFTKALVDYFPVLFDAAVKLFVAIVQAVPRIIPQLITAVMGLIPVITDTLLTAMPQLIDAGFQILKGLAEGIIKNAPRILGEAAKSIGNTLTNGVKALLGIRSPSQVFYDFGLDVGQGFVNGMRATFKDIENTALQLAQAAADRAQAALNKAGITSIYSNFGVPVNVTTRTGQLFDVGKATDDINAIYDYMGAKTREQMLEVEKFVLGMTFQEALDTLFVGVSNGTEELANSVQKVLDSFEGLSRGVAEAGLVPDEVNPFLNRFEQTQSGGGGLPQMALATGGFVQKPLNALVGEAGPEVVMPLDRFENLLGIGSAKPQGSTYNITINAGVGSDPVSIGRYVTDAIKRYESVSGKVFASA